MRRQKMSNANRIELRKLALGASILIAALSPTGCARTVSGEGSETHFVCSTDEDCTGLGSGYACEVGTCHTRSAVVAATADAGTDGAKSGPTGHGTGGPCGNDATAYGVSAPYPRLLIEILSYDPTAPALGDNTWTLLIRDQAGRPITGATMTGTELMPAHGHGGVKPVVIQEEGNGVYAVTMNFNMPGEWQTTVQIETPIINSQFLLDVSCVQ
jgi:hypothetical protein